MLVLKILEVIVQTYPPSRAANSSVLETTLQAKVSATEDRWVDSWYAASLGMRSFKSLLHQPGMS
jgi:hypothetical protein